MKPAVIVVDMIEDNFPAGSHGEREEEKIIAPLAAFLKICRQQAVPVIFACDSFLPGDFLFRARMKPHSIRGTAGTKPLAALEPQAHDIILEKRRFSAFFKTDLDQTLRTLGADTVLVAGITTNFCVLATAFDACGHDFATVIVEDACAAAKPEWHEATLSCYRRSILRPLFRVLTVDELLGGADG